MQKSYTKRQGHKKLFITFKENTMAALATYTATHEEMWKEPQRLRRLDLHKLLLWRYARIQKTDKMKT